MAPSPVFNTVDTRGPAVWTSAAPCGCSGVDSPIVDNLRECSHMSPTMDTPARTCDKSNHPHYPQPYHCHCLMSDR